MCKCDGHLLASRETAHGPASSQREEEEKGHGQGHHHLQQERGHTVRVTWASKREQTGMLGKVKDATGDTPKRERRRQVERRMGRRTGGGGREEDPRDLAPKWGRWRDHFSHMSYARLKSQLVSVQHCSPKLKPPRGINREHKVVLIETG